MKTLKEFMNTLDMGNFDKMSEVVDLNLVQLTVEAAGIAEHPRCVEIVAYATAASHNNEDFIKRVFDASDYCKD